VISLVESHSSAFTKCPRHFVGEYAAFASCVVCIGWWGRGIIGHFAMVIASNMLFFIIIVFVRNILI